MKIVVLSIVFFITLHASSQCLTDSIFHTDSIGTKNEKLLFPLTFVIRLDSINVFVSSNRKKPFMAFKIIGKSECNWDEKFMNGSTQYNALLLDNTKMKKALIKIIYYNDKRWIEVVYPEAEERVFTIIQTPSQ